MWSHIRKSPDWHFIAALITLMVLLQAIGPAYFRYEHDWLASGEIWRVITAHWVHVGWLHLLLNGLGLVICVILAHPRWSIRRWFTSNLALAIGISLALTLFNPEIGDYAGYSGVLYGLYALAAVRLFSSDRLVAALILTAIVGKVLIEQLKIVDFNTGSLIGAPVIVDAHLYGLLMAIAIALIWTRYTMNHSPFEQSD